MIVTCTPNPSLDRTIELDALLKLRKELNAREGADYKLSVNDFIIRACAMALIEVPEANVTWDDGQLRQYSRADISVAVALDEGLTRFPSGGIDTDNAGQAPTSTVRGWERLPVVTT